MGCLTDLIGSSLNCTPTEGRIAIGTLGITNKEITDYMSGDYASPEDFLADRIAAAELCVTTDMLTKLAPKMIGKTFLDSGRLGDFDERQELLTATANTIGGIVMDINSPQSNTTLLITRIDLWSDVGGNVTVTFTDLTDGTVLATQVVATTADRITGMVTDIELSIRRKRTRILVSTTLPTYYKSAIGLGGCSTCHGDSFKQGPVEAFGARISNTATMSYANLVRTSNTGGISLVATLACDHAAFICEHAGLLALPMAYKVAEEVIYYGIGNRDRVNSRVNNGQPDALRMRRDHFAKKYDDAMGRLWENMPLPSDPVCWVCNSKIRVANVLP